MKVAHHRAISMTAAQHNCKPPWTPHTLAVRKAARGRFTRCPCTRRLSACHGATERVQSGRRAPTLKAVRRAATTCSEEMTSCDHVDSWRNTLLRRPSSSAGQAGSAAWPQIARIGRQERPARRQTDECTTHDQFGAITRSRRAAAAYGVAYIADKRPSSQHSCSK